MKGPPVLDLLLRGADETAKSGMALGAVLRSGDVIGLSGDLGAGKTALVQGMAVGLDVPPPIRVTSPTFTLINEYRGGRVDLIHADLYRIERDAELDQLGLFEAFDEQVAVAIEWCDKFQILPGDHLRIELEARGDDARRLVAVAHGPRSAALLEAWSGALAAAAEAR